MLRRLLLFEDEPVFNQDLVRDYLSPEGGFDCKREVWNAATPQNLALPGIEAVLFAPGAEPALPMKVFSWLRKHPIGRPTLAILPKDCDDDLLRTAAEIVDEFLFTPVRGQELRCRVARILAPPDEGVSVGRLLKQELGLAQLVGEDKAFLQVIQEIPGIAASSAPVLLLGETGTGKELCAQAIHSLSSRHAGPFVPVECGAIPENLVENELFGHVRGAFTDAHCDQKGLAAMAEGGTLFLDEIDSLPQNAQAKLLRFIQAGTYRPLGSQIFSRANIKIIAATNRSLETCVRKKEFRADLYFRLNVLSLHLPPLRDRRGDIAVLTQHFLKTLLPNPNQSEKTLSFAALRVLEAHDWPGNVRELYNTLQRAVAFSAKSPILPVHLGLSLPAVEPGTSGVDFRFGRSRAIANFEKTYLEEMLSKNGGNVTHAARASGKDRRVFGRLMKRYGIDRRKYE